MQGTTNCDKVVQQVVVCIGLSDANCVEALLEQLKKVAMALILRRGRCVAESVDDLALIFVP